MKAVTISPVFIMGLLKGAMLKGYNPEEILLRQGLPPQILTNPKLRISTSAFARLHHNITRLLQDEACGLLKRPQPLGCFQLLSQACQSAETIRESITIWRNGINLLDTSMSAHTCMGETTGYLEIRADIKDGIDDHFIIENALTTAHRFLCWQAREFLPLERVHLAYLEPSFSDEYRFLFYGAPVHFEQEFNAIYFSHKYLNHKCVRTIAELKNLLEKPYVYLLTQPKQSHSPSIKVRIWMEKIFREGVGAPQLKEAAEFFETTEQTLRRRLKADGYSFLQLKEDTRRDMAIYYINNKQESVEDIAFRLGFSEASNFIRAFKKWTGLTPLAYRKLSKKQARTDHTLT